MLVYVRDDVKAEVLKPVADEEIPSPLQERFVHLHTPIRDCTRVCMCVRVCVLNRKGTLHPRHSQQLSFHLSFL